MRNLSKFLTVAVGILAIGLFSTSASANSGALAGTFTLARPTQWDKTMLPAGNYTFILNRTQTENVNLLEVRGEKQKFTMYVRGEWACEACQNAKLYLAPQGSQFVVTSMDMAGFHANFKVRQPAGAREELAKMPQRSEQIAVHVDPN
jgi:hypothetical protein